MQSGMFRTICSVGIFMICAQTVVNFRPKASYEKYLRLLMGGMILIQLLNPVVRLLGGDASDLEVQLAEFDERLQMGIYGFTGFTYEAVQSEVIPDDATEISEAEADTNIEIDTQIEPVEINIPTAE